MTSILDFGRNIQLISIPAQIAIRLPHSFWEQRVLFFCEESSNIFHARRTTSLAFELTSIIICVDPVNCSGRSAGQDIFFEFLEIKELQFVFVAYSYFKNLPFENFSSNHFHSPCQVHSLNLSLNSYFHKRLAISYSLLTTLLVKVFLFIIFGSLIQYFFSP